MRKRNRISKYTDEAVLIETTITEVLEHNKEYSERIKNVFKCTSRSGEDRLCILWGRSNISAGDKIQMKGRIKDDVFLAWDLMILKKADSKGV